jgi:arylsulfatase A
VNQDVQHFGDMVAYMDKLIGQLLAGLDALGLRDNTLVLFVGDNGTGRGVKSRMGDKVVAGGKGRTTETGMHVPLIAHWPQAGVVGGRVCPDLVDSTDFLPTLLEAAGVKPPAGLKVDGRSFLPQLRGQAGRPREWIYSWYSPRQSADMTVREFAFNHRYKLYRTGEFFDVRADAEEQRPQDPSGLGGEAADAARLLQGALDQFRNARPTALDRAFESANPAAATKAKAKKKAPQVLP